MVYRTCERQPRWKNGRVGRGSGYCEETGGISRGFIAVSRRMTFVFDRRRLARKLGVEQATIREDCSRIRLLSVCTRQNAGDRWDGINRLLANDEADRLF